MIDVIICAYNGHSFIEKAIKSVVKQTCINYITITIVNNGSNENYQTIINKYKNKVNIREVTIKKNKGQWHGSQFGIDNTEGEYFTFLDCDDELLNPKSLEEMKKIMDNDKQIQFIEGKIVSKHGSNYPIFMIHAVLFRRNFIKKYNIKFKNFYYEDVGYYLYCNMLAKEYEIKKIDINVYKYNISLSTSSVTSTKNNKKAIIDNYFHCFESLQKYAKKRRIKIDDNKYFIFFEFLYHYHNQIKKTDLGLVYYDYLLNRCSKFYKKYKTQIKKGIKNENDINMHSLFTTILSVYN